MPAKKRTVTLEQIYEKLTNHDTQFVKVFEKLSAHDKQFANAATQLFNFEDSLRKEIKGLEIRIQTIDTNLEKLTGDLETLTQEYHAITAALKRIEERLGDTGQGSESIRSELDSLKGRITLVEERILVLESK